MPGCGCPGLKGRTIVSILPFFKLFDGVGYKMLWGTIIPELGT